MRRARDAPRACRRERLPRADAPPPPRAGPPAALPRRRAGAQAARAAGCALNQAEAVALIADEVCEAARDGRSYAEAEAAGYAALGPGDVADGRRRARAPRRGRGAVRRRQPADRAARPDRRASGPPPLGGARARMARARARALTVVNEGEVAGRRHVALPLLRGQPRAALRPRRGLGHAARDRARREGLLRPGRRRARSSCVPFGGARVIRGHAGLADGPLDARGRARGGARARARAGLPRCLSGVRLADSDLWLVPEADDVGGPDRILPGFGNTMRDGLGVRAERGGVELAIVGGLVADPVLGVRDTQPRDRATGGSSRSAAPATRTRWTASTSCSTRPPRSSTRPA